MPRVVYMRGCTMPMEDVMDQLKRRGRPIDVREVEPGLYQIIYRADDRLHEVRFNKEFDVLEEGPAEPGDPGFAPIR